MWGTAFKLGLGWAGGEYASAGKRDNFDKGEEEDDAAHNFLKDQTMFYPLRSYLL